MKKKPSKPSSDEKIVLNQAEREAIAATERQTVELKCRLANLVIQQQILGQDVILAERAMIDKIGEIAGSHGIPVEDANKWSLSTKTMTFTKLAGPR